VSTFTLPSDLDRWGKGERLTLAGRRVYILRRGPVTLVVTKHPDDEYHLVTKIHGGRELGHRRLRNLPPSLRRAIENTNYARPAA
jgi:hypothetical protein